MQMLMPAIAAAQHSDNRDLAANKATELAARANGETPEVHDGLSHRESAEGPPASPFGSPAADATALRT